MWVRRCDECGHVQPARKPQGEMSPAYRDAKCRRCGSMGLDYGKDYTPPDPDPDPDYNFD